MIERGLITAAVVVFIIGVLGEIGEQANKALNGLSCALSTDPQCESNKDGGENGELGGDSKSRDDEDTTR